MPNTWINRASLLWPFSMWFCESEDSGGLPFPWSIALYKGVPNLGAITGWCLPQLI
jgi:hypothetical protein